LTFPRKRQQRKSAPRRKRSTPAAEATLTFQPERDPQESGARSADQLFNATSTSSSIFFASPNSIRLFSL
jgi:hypothetical protein